MDKDEFDKEPFEDDEDEDQFVDELDLDD